ncbi:hypothetical protein [Paenibacillus daejeonensis]|uniref:hypothetical protein n=1 Tax=Paenibacillus daejeonensis TaxID=135193 RepID=UPI00036019F4|nr:hypothetical protein [Paenibacillus daejeonensis]
MKVNFILGPHAERVKKAAQVHASKLVRQEMSKPDFIKRAADLSGRRRVGNGIASL